MPAQSMHLLTGRGGGLIGLLDRQPGAAARRAAPGVPGRPTMDDDLAALLEMDRDGGSSRASAPAASVPLWDDDRDDEIRSRRV